MSKKPTDQQIIAEIDKILSEFDDVELRNKFLNKLIKELEQEKNTFNLADYREIY